MYGYAKNAQTVENELKALKATIVTGVEENVRQGLITRATGDEFLASLGLVSQEKALVEAQDKLKVFKGEVDAAIEAEVENGTIDKQQANEFRRDLSLPTRKYDA